MILRPYQADLIEQTREALRHTPSVLIQCATGSGKTVLAAFMSGTAAGRGRRVWFLAHRDFLLEQTAATFDAVGITYSFIAAGRYYDATRAVQICSVQSLVRRLERLEPPDLIIWDEAHHVAATGYKRIRDFSRTARHIGLSATPARLDGKGLSLYFGTMVLGPSTASLIEQGYLSQYRAFAPSVPNLRGIHTRAGDYARDEIDGLMDTDKIVGDLVRHYREKADGKRTIYFAVSVRHSKHIAATFAASGIAAIHLDGDATTQCRLHAASAFGRGDIRVVSNVDLFGEGYDLSAQAKMDVAVEAVGLARPTQSLALHLQQIGRALRPKPEPTIILDHAGNCHRHGLPDDPREWSLSGIDRKSRPVAEVKIRQCMACYAVCSPSRRECPECGVPFPVQYREVDEVSGELEELARKAAAEDARRSERRSVGLAKSRDELAAIARARGYKPGWVDHILKARGMKQGARA